MESIWNQQSGFEHYPQLDRDLKIEAAVIGGGLTGVLTAYFLSQQGVRTAVIEASRIGSGQTGGTTAKITSQHNLIYHKLIKAAGEEQAAQYARANQRAIERYAEVIEKENISCGFSRQSAYLYSTDKTDKIEKELTAAQKLGLPASFCMPDTLPFPVKGAVRFDGQAQFNPLQFLHAVAKNLTIFENTKAVAVEGNTILTERGNVTADAIVLATHYPIINKQGLYFMRMHQQRSYVLALENAADVKGMYLDIDPAGYSLRNVGQTLLLGGAGHRTGEPLAGGSYARLRRAAREFYPQSREAAFWSAQDCMTLDEIPYIGQHTSSAPHLYVASGFQKWGMTTAMVAAELISDTILGKDNPDCEVFSPQRFHPAASAKNLLQDGGKAIQGIGKEFLTFPQDQAEQIPPGQGKVIALDGEKIGVYRDIEGELFSVSVKCPHLGCQLEWNPDELSWDCPCHGSRFDYRGKLLDNPALRGLKSEQRSLLRPES